MRRIASRAAPILAALFITALPFYRVLLFEDRALLYRDIYRHFLVGKQIWARAVAAGEGIPFWNYFSFGGMRFWAENVNSPLHPLNFLFLIFQEGNGATAMSLFIWLHYPLIFLGGYALCRVLGRRKTEALIFSSAIGLSGVAMSAHNITHSLCAYTSVPWFFAFWILYLRKRKWTHLFGASFALAWPIYGGDPQFTYVLSVLALLLCVIHPSRIIGWKAKVTGFLSLGALSLAASAAQLLPTAEFVMDSGRGLGNLKKEELLAFSFHPIRLLETLWPQFFGNRFGPDPFWGERYVNFPFGTPFLFSTYPGTLVLLLAFVSPLFLIRDWRKRVFSAHYLWMSFLLGIVLCFGIFSILPLYEFFLDFFPLFGAFRYPERLLFWPFLALWASALLAFPRVQAALRHSQTGRFLFIVWGGFLTLNLISLAAFQFDLVHVPPASSASVMKSTFWAASFVLIFWLFRKKTLGRKGLLTSLLITQAVELASVQTLLVWDQSKHITDARRYPIVDAIRSELEEKKDVFLAGGARRFHSWGLPNYQFLPGRMDHTTLSTFAGFEVLASNASGIYGIEDIGGYFALVQREKLLFWEAMMELRNLEPNFDRALDLAGAYFLPSRGENQEMKVAKNEDALPYVFLTPEIVGADGFDASLRALKRPGHDFRRTTVVAGMPDPAQLLETRGKIQITSRNGREFRVQLQRESLNTASFLVWNESHDRHWKAYVNGEKLPVYRANAWAMGVLLPAQQNSGATELRFSYENPWIGAGVLVSTAWLLLFFLVALWERRRAA